MKNENEAVSVNFSSKSQLINGPSNSLNYSELKNDLNNNLKQEINKPKLKVDSQTYIPKFLKSSTNEKILDNNNVSTSHIPSTTNTTTTSNTLQAKPTNPTYIPYQGGSSFNPQTLNGLKGLNGIKINPIQSEVANNINENDAGKIIDSKMININSATYIPKRLINKSKEIVQPSLNNLSKSEEEKETIKSDVKNETINNNINAVSSINSKPNENKLGVLFQKKAENNNKQTDDLTNKKINPTQENVEKKSNLEELKSSKQNELERTNKIIQVEINKEKYEDKIMDKKEIKRTEKIEDKKEDKKSIIKEENKEVIKEEYKILNSYFKVNNKEKEKKFYNLDYLMKFKNWKISKEDKLITDFLKGHHQQMKVFKDDFMIQPKLHKGSISNSFQNSTANTNNNQFDRNSKIEAPKENYYSNKNVNNNISIISKEDLFSRQPSTTTISSVGSQAKSIGDFARKNIDEDNKMAQDYKEKISNILRVDPIRDALTEHLNKLTLDNYEFVKENVLEVIKDDVVHQEKLIEVLFKKAIVEWAYAVIYSKLCFDLDRDLPQKVDSDKKSSTSVFRKKLLEKCKTIFQEDLKNIEKYITVSDPDEKEDKIKKFTLGNVNFIGELINTKLISKKVFLSCVEHLFEKATNINIEGLVILLEKFGTSMNKSDAKIKNDEFNELNDKISYYINELDRRQEKDRKLPGFIKYKIINLREKKNRGWIESKVDQSLKIKSKQEVGAEYDKEQREKGNYNYQHINYNNYEPEEDEYGEYYAMESNNPIECTGPKKDSDDYIKSELKKDYEEFREYISEGNDELEYRISVTDKLKKNNSLGAILKNFSEVVIDTAGHPEDIDYCFKYIKVVFESYSSGLMKNPVEKKEISTAIIEILSLLNEFVLDNMYLTDIWGSIIHVVVSLEITNWKDFEVFRDMTEEQIQCITEVMCKAILYFDDKSHQSLVDELQKYSIFKANKNLFNFTWKSISSIK